MEFKITQFPKILFPINYSVLLSLGQWPDHTRPNHYCYHFTIIIFFIPNINLFSTLFHITRKQSGTFALGIKDKRRAQHVCSSYHKLLSVGKFQRLAFESCSSQLLPNFLHFAVSLSTPNAQALFVIHLLKLGMHK